MKEFVLLFRLPDYSKAGQEKMQAIAKKWQDWTGGIVAQEKLANNGIRLSSFLQTIVIVPITGSSKPYPTRTEVKQSKGRTG